VFDQRVRIELDSGVSSRVYSKLTISVGLMLTPTQGFKKNEQSAALDTPASRSTGPVPRPPEVAGVVQLDHQEQGRRGLRPAADDLKALGSGSDTRRDDDEDEIEVRRCKASEQDRRAGTADRDGGGRGHRLQLGKDAVRYELL
jgi:hypothetical protein